MTTSALHDALSTLESVNRGEIERIDGNQVREWMRVEDIQLLGVVYYMMFDRRYHPRIKPPLTVIDYKNFLLPYYARCFLEDPQVDWASTRYTAGWDLVGWFKSLWRDRSVPRALLDDIKKWLGDLYRSSGDDVREAIVTATLEHLFEDRKIARFFSDWRDDGELQSAYASAMQWPAGDRKAPA